MTIFLLTGHSNSSLEIKPKNSENPTNSKGLTLLISPVERNRGKSLCSLQLIDIAH